MQGRNPTRDTLSSRIPIAGYIKDFHFSTASQAFETIHDSVQLNDPSKTIKSDTFPCVLYVECILCQILAYPLILVLSQRWPTSQYELLFEFVLRIYQQALKNGSIVLGATFVNRFFIDHITTICGTNVMTLCIFFLALIRRIM